MRLLPPFLLLLTVAATDSDSVGFSVTATPAGASVLYSAVKHILATCNYPSFTRRTVLLDFGPSVHSYATSDIALLREQASRLVSEGVIDGIRSLAKGKIACDIILEQFSDGGTSDGDVHDLCANVAHWNGHKGFLSFAQEIADCHQDYCVHIDLDMLGFSSPESSWIEKGLQILKQDTNALLVMPRSSPKPVGPEESQHKINVIESRRGQYHPRENWWTFTHMTTRMYLMSKSRFVQRILPLPYVPDMDWERLVSARMFKQGMVRVDLNDNDAWLVHFGLSHDMMHPAVHPLTVELIEGGMYPREQEGRYDAVASKLWLELLGRVMPNEVLAIATTDEEEPLPDTVWEIISKLRSCAIGPDGRCEIEQ